MKKTSKVFMSYVIIILSIYLYLYFTQDGSINSISTKYVYSDLIKDLTNEDKEDILKLVIVSNSETSNIGTAKIYKNKEKLNEYTEVFIPAIDKVNDIINTDIVSGNSFIVIDTVKAPNKNALFQSISMIMIFGFAIFVIGGMLKKGGDNNKAMGFGKSKAKMIVDEGGKNNFTKVAGLKEEKVELKEIVEFLKAPKKFFDIGAKIPKGVLLVGQPGTGKTLLAKAVAGEASVPFYTISGSDFVEMFVGVGASRVRDLFKTAKKNAPCIIFIDEIDAVGRKRGSGLGGGHDEREQTLNQLLVEMDGFSENTGIIVLAATNRPDILDSALLRPGRFDRQVTIGMPSIKDRVEILHVHSKNKKIGDDVDLEVIAKTTSGFTGAQLEALLNESAILAARENEKVVTMSHIKDAFIKVGIGTEKKSRVISKKERIITAYHEIGHGIMQDLLTELDPVHIISIIPTGSAGGYTMHLPIEERSYTTQTYMEQSIVSLLGGRCAEEIMLGEITTGASNDIERATSIARKMVTKYGMSKKVGNVQFGVEPGEMFLGNRQSYEKNYSENMAKTIDEEVKKIIDDNYEKALKILNENKDVLESGKEILLKEDKISGEDFRKLFKDGVLPKKDIPVLNLVAQVKKEEKEYIAKEKEEKERKEKEEKERKEKEEKERKEKEEKERKEKEEKERKEKEEKEKDKLEKKEDNKKK